MDITFSEVYQPLYEVLEAWNVINDPNFKKEYSEEEQEYWTSLAKVDTILISGGRDSGKTFTVSTWNPIAAVDYNHRILYTRQTMSSTDNSITEALEGRMESVGYLDKFTTANKTYSVKDGIGKISITGHKTSSGNQSAKLKSLEDFSVFITEEGEELESYDKWKKIKRSMRAKDVQCLSIIVFNPPTREHWIAEEFYEDVEEGFNGVKGKVLYIHSTYLDNGKENMAPHNWEEYTQLKEQYELYLSTPKDQRELLPNKVKKDYEQYKYNILGGFKRQAEGVIYEDWEEGEFDESLIHKCYGMDFGSRDPDALVKVAIDHKRMRIYLSEEYYKNNTKAAVLMQVLHDRVGFTQLIVADTNERRLRLDLRDGMHGIDGKWMRGVNIVGAKKAKGSVIRTIKTIQSYTLVVTPKSVNIKRSLNNYVWHDKVAEVPNHNWSHIPNAFGYGAMELIDR